MQPYVAAWKWVSFKTRNPSGADFRFEISEGPIRVFNLTQYHRRLRPPGTALNVA